MASDLNAEDLDELRQLHAIAKRPRIRSFLSSHIEELEKSQHTAAVQIPAATPLPIQTAAQKAPSVSYTTFGSFSWDQDKDKVKVYLFVEGVDREKVVSEFKEWSFDIKLHDVNGKNFRCGVPKLHKAIVPEQCQVFVKPQRVTISMRKAEKDHWTDIHYKEDKFKTSKPDENKDPMAGIMDLMKNMYEQGDDDMKRTIAKAWTDARSGKSDPMKGLGSDL